MRKESCLKVIMVGLSVMVLGADAQVPIKTINPADGGRNCDSLTEQFMHVEGLDSFDHPKFTIRWRQTTGPCGKAIDESELASWEGSYDGSSPDAPDSPPSDGSKELVKLELLICCPFGEYEFDLDIQSYDDESTTRTSRFSFEVENGHDEYHIWDSFESDVTNDEAYSPTIPGNYTWPLDSATGYYKTFYAGLLPPVACESRLPAGTETAGCFNNGSSAEPLLNSGYYVLSDLGPDGMSPQVCSDFCTDFDYFGLESGSECFCGTADEFESAVESDQCGTTYPSLCTGDATTACGGFGAISVYQRIGDTAPAPAPTQEPAPAPSPTHAPAPAPAPSPTHAPAPTPTDTSETTYSLAGCFADSQTNRIMENKMVEDVMSAKICHELCDDGVNTHFGTQYAEECWCAVEPDLTKNGEELALYECDMACEGTTSGEFCGGRHKETAYKIEDVVTGYVGCYADDRAARAMNANGKFVWEDMTNEVCISHCAASGHAYAGTQNSKECWCGGDSFSVYGDITNGLCSFRCSGDAQQICGGFDALSVYSTA